MMFALVIAQASAAEGGLGVSIASLVSSLTAAGAAVVVTTYFLGFLKDHGHDHKLIIEQFRGYHLDSQRKFQDQIDRLADRQEESLSTFRARVGRVTATQNAMLSDAIQTMRSIEKTLEGSNTTIQGIESTIEALKKAIRAIDLVIASADQVTGETRSS